MLPPSWPTTTNVNWMLESCFAGSNENSAWLLNPGRGTDMAACYTMWK